MKLDYSTMRKRDIVLINGDNRKRFLRRLFPSEKDIRKQRGSNPIISRSVVVCGGQGTGKSEFFISLVGEANYKYGEENVNAIVSDGDPKNILAKGLTKQLVQLICVDDATLAISTRNKEGRQRARYFFKMRHYAKEIGKMNKGLIICVFNTHRYYNIPTEFRSEFFYVVFKSIPTNPFDRNMVERYIGGNGVDDLRTISRKREIDLSANKYSIYYCYDGSTGLIKLKLFKPPNVKRQTSDLDQELIDIYTMAGIDLDEW